MYTAASKQLKETKCFAVGIYLPAIRGVENFSGFPSKVNQDGAIAVGSLVQIDALRSVESGRSVLAHV